VLSFVRFHHNITLAPTPRIFADLVGSAARESPRAQNNEQASRVRGGEAFQVTPSVGLIPPRAKRAALFGSQPPRHRAPVRFVGSVDAASIADRSDHDPRDDVIKDYLLNDVPQIPRYWFATGLYEIDQYSAVA
jgi:hypothetical protein